MTAADMEVAIANAFRSLPNAYDSKSDVWIVPLYDYEAMRKAINFDYDGACGICDSAYTELRFERRWCHTPDASWCMWFLSFDGKLIPEYPLNP